MKFTLKILEDIGKKTKGTSSTYGVSKNLVANGFPTQKIAISPLDLEGVPNFGGGVSHGRLVGGNPPPLNQQGYTEALKGP